MKRMILYIFFILLCLAGAAAGGVRIHPEALFVKAEAPGAGLYKMTFRSGQVMFAELLKEGPKDLMVRAGGSTFELAKADLSEFRPVSAQDEEDPSFKEWDFSGPQESWISYSKDKNLFLKISKASESLKKNPEDLISSAMEKAGEAASSQKKAASSKMAMYEAIVRKNVGSKAEY